MSSQSARRPARSWVVPVAVLAVLALLITLVLNLSGGSQEPDTGAAPAAQSESSATEDPSDAAPTEVQGAVQPALTDIERRDEADPLAAGPVDAPVALVIFSDYQCPYCARWSEDTLPVMLERAEAGDLRVEWRDVNIFGVASERASRAAYAAALQDSFWDYHDALYPDGETRSEGDLSQEALEALAGDLGLDTEKFAEDMHSPATDQAIAGNAKLGLDIGAYSTPAFILGGQPIVGAQPTQVFVDALDTALAS
ncbi:thioredoxin domain-containing protein [Ornithinimicrobium faecis]|uniref:Thioredoxin domain-containing protein n=1 Tax=Ornithinimicrobium faecis TaxID=2934158 RepID=A0ABY4YZ18_9MICO|nr:thioredoxin domain-containing protein [Ornithinimicrobium sp. HY1793]USQ81991.1 thioredoxin domain-containing protein [Ornithinimicrobium sp. HY1793]